MPNYGYSQSFQGSQSVLPPGYLEAATAPGRNLARGIEGAGENIGKLLDHYRLKDEERQYNSEVGKSNIGEIAPIITSKEASVPGTPEYNLNEHIKHLTGQDTPDGLAEYVKKMPTLALPKLKAVNSELQFALQRYDKNRVANSEIEARNASTGLTKLQTDLLPKTTDLENRLKALEAEKAQYTLGQNQKLPAAMAEALAIPTTISGQVSHEVDPESGAPLNPTTTSTTAPYPDIYKKVQGVFAKHGINAPPDLIHNTTLAMGVSPELPEGMTAMGASVPTTGGGTLQGANNEALINRAIQEKAPEINKDIRERSFILPSGRQATAPTVKDAEELKGLTSDYTTANQNIDSLLKIIKDHSMGGILSPEAYSLAGVDAPLLASKIQRLMYSGKPNQYELQTAASIAANPTKWLSLTVNNKTKLEELRRNLKNKMDARLGASGINETPNYKWNAHSQSLEE